MTRPDRAAHLLLYDGECGLCNRVTQFVLRYDGRRRYDFAALQSAEADAILERFGQARNAMDTFYVVANYRGAAPMLHAKSAAALFIATSLGWPWKTAGLVRVLPDTVLNRLYDFVARNRYSVFGRQQCLIPRPEDRSRFIDLRG